MLEVKPTSQCTATVSDKNENVAIAALLQKHLPGGCTIIVPLSNVHQQGAHRFAT